MIKSSKDILSQRLHYLLFGNSHGVSANWLSKKCGRIYQNIDSLVDDDWFWLGINKTSLEEGKILFKQVTESFSGINYTKNFDCEQGLAAFLYAWVLSNKPAIVVETGVANGITTNVIMKALEKTGGILHSIDIDPQTRNVYRGPGEWNFHLLSKDYEINLKGIARGIGEVNLWIHDSNHGYTWQSFEYQVATQSLAIGGLLVSDDVDSSTAWGLASESAFKNSICIFDNRKFFGIANI